MNPVRVVIFQIPYWAAKSCYRVFQSIFANAAHISKICRYPPTWWKQNLF